MSAYGEYNVRKRKDKDKSQVKTSGISEGLSNSCTGALMEREKKDSAEYLRRSHSALLTLDKKIRCSYHRPPESLDL